MLKMGLASCLSTDCKTDTLLTSAHNDMDDTDSKDDVDDTDTTDDAGDYNRVIGIALLKAFSCANKTKMQMHLNINDM